MKNKENIETEIERAQRSLVRTWLVLPHMQGRPDVPGWMVNREIDNLINELSHKYEEVATDTSDWLCDSDCQCKIPNEDASEPLTFPDHPILPPGFNGMCEEDFKTDPDVFLTPEEEQELFARMLGPHPEDCSCQDCHEVECRDPGDYRTDTQKLIDAYDEIKKELE